MARSRLSTVNFGSAKAGLLTVGYTLYNTNASVHQARTTSGVAEFGTTGVYGANVMLPSEKAVLVMWDTGEATPRYGNEDNNVQLDAIQDGTDQIRLIWNSIKNQGALVNTIMQKLGVIEKNKGVVKPELDAAIASIKFPAQQEIRMPDMEPISSSLGKIEGLAGEIKAAGESNFSNMNAVLSSAILRLSDSVKTSNAESRARASQLVAELKAAQKTFSQMDAVLAQIQEMAAARKAEDGTKAAREIEEKIMREVKKLRNLLVNTISLVQRAPDGYDAAEIVRMFGGK